MNGWLIGISTLLAIGAAALILVCLATAARADRLIRDSFRKPRMAARARSPKIPRGVQAYPAPRGSRRSLAPVPQQRVRAVRPEVWRFASRQAP